MEIIAATATSKKTKHPSFKVEVLQSRHPSLRLKIRPSSAKGPKMHDILHFLFEGSKENQQCLYCCLDLHDAPLKDAI